MNNLHKKIGGGKRKRTAYARSIPDHGEKVAWNKLTKEKTMMSPLGLLLLVALGVSGTFWVVAKAVDEKKKGRQWASIVFFSSLLGTAVSYYLGWLAW